MTCARLWAAEAVRDGRLIGTEAAAARLHQKTCRECADEARRLEALGQSLRALPAPPADDLSARRDKQRLLSAVDQQALGGRPDRARVLALGLALAALPLAALSIRSAAPQTPAATVASVGQARWEQHRQGNDETITLSEGTLALRVKKRSPDEHVRVLVPDGEIEDLGTTFSVEVHQGHTTRIAVEDGAVRFRRPGLPAVSLLAGQSWSLEEAPPAIEPTPPGSAEPPAPAPSSPAPPLLSATLLQPSALALSAPVVIAPSAPLSPRVMTRSASTQPATAPSSATPTPSPSAAAFRDGFRALRDGRPQEAAEQLAHATNHTADDPRAEDASYLRIVALGRAGEREQAQAAARDYLQRFPRGFRRPEVEALLR